MRPEHIVSRPLAGRSPDAYPQPTRQEPRDQSPQADWSDPPASVILELEAGMSRYGAVCRALWAAGWSQDKVSILEDLVATCQGPGLYYIGVISGGRVRLTLWEVV